MGKLYTFGVEMTLSLAVAVLQHPLGVSLIEDQYIQSLFDSNEALSWDFWHPH